MKKIKRILPFPFAKLQAILAAHLGLLLGIFYAFGGLIYDLLTTHSVNLGTGLAFLALLGMPLLLAIGGFFLGLLEALLYNVFSRWYGGISYRKDFFEIN